MLFALVEMEVARFSYGSPPASSNRQWFGLRTSKDRLKELCVHTCESEETLGPEVHFMEHLSSRTARIALRRG